MWPSEKMKFSPYVIISILLLTFLCDIKCEISDLRLCGDAECLDPVSTGRTIIDYPSSGSGILSFKKNVKVQIMSKSAGTRPDLWGVEINGKRGYVPKNFIREDKILKKQLSFVVSTAETVQDKINLEDISNENITTDIPLEKPIELSASVENTVTTEPKATENLQENPTSVEQSSEEIVKDLDPASSSYEVIGDTTIYYSTLSDEEILHSTSKPEDIKVNEIDQEDDIVNITTSVSVSESVEIHSNVELDAQKLEEGVKDKLDLNSNVDNKKLIENTIEDSKEVPDTQDENLEPSKDNILSNNVSSETSVEDQKDSKEIEANLVDGKLNLNLDNLDKLNLNIDLADPLKLLDQAKTEKPVNVEITDDLKEVDDKLLNSEHQNVNIDELQAPASEKNVPHNHNIINNYLFKNHNVMNDESNKIVKLDGLAEEESAKIVKRDVSEQIVSTETLTPETKADNVDEILPNINQINTESLANTEVPLSNPTINSISSETLKSSPGPLTPEAPAISSEVTDLPTPNINSESPKLNTEIPAYEQNVPLNIETIPFTNSYLNPDQVLTTEQPLINTEQPFVNTEPIINTEQPLINTEQPFINTNQPLINTEQPLVNTEQPFINTEQPFVNTEQPFINTAEPFINTEQPLVNHEFNYKVDAVTENPYNTLLETMQDIKEPPIENVNSESAIDPAYPPFKELPGSIPASIPDIIADAKEQLLTEKPDVISNNDAKPSSPIGEVEEIIYNQANSEPEQIPNKEPENSEIKDEGNFVDWVYGLIFGSSENKEIVDEPEIENNLNELDNRHDGLLSRLPNDKGVCTDENSDCLASDIFTKPQNDQESFADSIIRDIAENSGTTFVYLSVTAITVLVFTLGYYYIETWRQDGSLLRKVNTLEQALMVSSKECEILKQDLGATKNKLTSIKEGAFGSNEEVISLQEEKKKLEMTIVEKDKELDILQKEFESATETGLELNKMLHDMMLTAQKGDTIAESMEQAQLQLNEQKETINSMSNALSARSRENSALQVKLKEHEMQIENIQKLLENEKSSNTLLKDERVKMEEQLQLLNVQLSKFKEENSYEILQVRSELTETQRDLYAKTSQVQLLEDCIKTLKSGKNVDISDLADIAKLQSDLQRVTGELNSSKEKSIQETEARKKLEDNIKSLEIEMAKLIDEHHRAEKDKLEAQTRLEVLSSYFKEKETQLQKELGIQEALWQQKQGEATSTVERLHSMQDEIQSLKSQNQSLRIEIEQQAAAHRSQVTTLESRVHEAWLSSRQAQRKLEESRQEASTLRRKLTSLMEQENMQKRGSSPLEVQLSAASPIHMNSAVSPILPPPLPFLPPPYLPPPPMGTQPPPHFMPPFMGDMRPPPLGRLPSPPRQRRGHYSPSMASERYSPESRAYSPESRAYSPDSRAYSPDYRRPISPYDTETDISPPGSPYRNKYNSYNSRRDEQNRLSKGVNSAESTETLNRNGRNHTTSAV